MENTINIQYISEIAKLARWLKERGIEYSMRTRVDGFQIVADEWDAVCFTGTYGAQRGLLEVMGSIVTGDDDVEGYLTADEILRRLDG